MDEFRFHMTLTGRLEDARREPVLDLLRERFERIGLSSLAIDSIALFKQTEAHSRFRVLGEWRLWP